MKPAKIPPGTAVLRNQTFGVHIRVLSVRIPGGTKGCGKLVLTHISTIDLYDNLLYFEREIQQTYLSGTTPFLPTFWVFAGWRPCCLISAN